MKIDKKFAKRGGNGQQEEATAHACAYTGSGVVGINIHSKDLGWMAIRMSPEEAEMLARQLIDSACDMRKFQSKAA